MAQNHSLCSRGFPGSPDRSCYRPGTAGTAIARERASEPDRAIEAIFDAALGGTTETPVAAAWAWLCLRHDRPATAFDTLEDALTRESSAASRAVLYQLLGRVFDALEAPEAAQQAYATASTMRAAATSASPLELALAAAIA